MKKTFVDFEFFPDFNFSILKSFHIISSKWLLHLLSISSLNSVFVHFECVSFWFPLVSHSGCSFSRCYCHFSAFHCTCCFTTPADCCYCLQIDSLVCCGINWNYICLWIKPCCLFNVRKCCSIILYPDR